MLFNFALFAGLLLTPEALAIPARLAARARQSQLPNVIVGNGSDTTDGTVYYTNWAGAVWSENAGTFYAVTGTFTVPTPSNPDSGSDWSSASAWVGIDGSSCRTAIFQTGVDLTVDDGQVSYDAWYEWWPAYAQEFPGITISAGDVVRLTVTATSAISGTATVENLTNGQTVSESLTATNALCQQDAEWIVEDYLVNGQLVPFTDFGTVTFTNAEANGINTPSGATIAEMVQNSQVLTSVSTSESSVTIKYV